MQCLALYSTKLLIFLFILLQLSSISEQKQFHRLGVKLLLAFCLSSGLSIALSKILLGLLLALWLIRKFLLRGQEVPLFEAPLLGSQKFLVTPMALWLSVALFASFVGIDFSNSLEEWGKSSLHFLFPLLILSVLNCASSDSEALKSISKMITCLALSLSMAAIHSFISSALGYSIPPKIPGPVTESGQLAMVIPLLLGVCLSSSARFEMREKLSFGLSLVLIILGSWPSILGLGPLAGVTVVVAGLSILVVPVVLDKFGGSRWPVVSFAILLASLVINLKRGPWLGVFSAIIGYGLLASRKLVLVATFVAISVFIAFSPVRERTFDIVEHFNIGGGRGEIWTLGMELVQRYPLGVGPDNASVIQEMDSQLPELHRHMHNNLLNITVETGWLGLTIFCLWIFRLLYASLTRYRAKSEPDFAGLLLLSTACALIAWQVAGLVEYNFGDGEVRLIAFCLTGFIITLVGIVDRQKDEDLKIDE